MSSKTDWRSTSQTSPKMDKTSTKATRADQVKEQAGAQCRAGERTGSGVQVPASGHRVNSKNRTPPNPASTTTRNKAKGNSQAESSLSLKPYLRCPWNTAGEISERNRVDRPKHLSGRRQANTARCSPEQHPGDRHSNWRYADSARHPSGNPGDRLSYWRHAESADIAWNPSEQHPGDKYSNWRYADSARHPSGNPGDRLSYWRHAESADIAWNPSEQHPGDRFSNWRHAESAESAWYPNWRGPDNARYPSGQHPGNRYRNRRGTGSKTYPLAHHPSDGTKTGSSRRHADRARKGSFPGTETYHSHHADSTSGQCQLSANDVNQPDQTGSQDDSTMEAFSNTRKKASLGSKPTVVYAEEYSNSQSDDCDPGILLVEATHHKMSTEDRDTTDDEDFYSFADQSLQDDEGIYLSAEESLGERATTNSSSTAQSFGCIQDHRDKGEKNANKETSTLQYHDSFSRYSRLLGSKPAPGGPETSATDGGQQGHKAAEDTGRGKQEASKTHPTSLPAFRNQRPQDPREHGNGGRVEQGTLHCGDVRPVEVCLSSCDLRGLQSKEPEEMVEALFNMKEALSTLLEDEDKLTADDGMMQLLLTCLAKVSQCQSAACGAVLEQKADVLNVVRSSHFLKSLGTFLGTKSTTAETEEMTQIIGESADFLKNFITLFPSLIHDVLMVQAFMDIALARVTEEGEEDTLPDIIAKKMDEFEVVKGAALKELHTKKKQNRRHTDHEDDLTPPDDFRQMSVFPTIDDLYVRPFLRKNKPVGGYTSVDHYLDVQFRLLREDFVSPLRDGIAEYLRRRLENAESSHREKRLRDIHVFHKVHILRSILTESGVDHRLSFDLTGLERVRWEVSKRLTFGSLVCLSADEFRTLYFATVSNSDRRDLSKGIVDVTFEGSLQEMESIPRGRCFVMAESTAFFEAYRHVLAGLQNMQGPDLPFHIYIVHCQKDVAPPRYLMQDTKYDLHPLVNDEIKLKDKDKSPARRPTLHERLRAARERLRQKQRELELKVAVGKEKSEATKSVAVLNRELWPDPQLLLLDDTQFQALHCALTKEFCLIQGPPGTGKTYVGLKIVKALLHNREAWDPGQDSTMLIVCYTNHALDQFLEGIISFYSEPGKVVRVGSRLSTEKLKPFSMANLRREYRHAHMFDDRREILQNMEHLQDGADILSLKVELAKRELLREEVLKPYMRHWHYEALCAEQSRTRGIYDWLGIDGLLTSARRAAQTRGLQKEQSAEDMGYMDIDGDIQALEFERRLDTDSFSFREAEDKERQKLERLAKARKSYLALDISSLDKVGKKQKQGRKKGKGEVDTLEQMKEVKRQLLEMVGSADRMTTAQEEWVKNVWTLKFHQRWRLYRLWTHSLCQDLKAKMREMEERYTELTRRYKETQKREDRCILEKATVVAMTTTGAARYQETLREVKPRVIVVEEAAEVLEGHVITTLNENCQHLILIGDHKQLRPNPTVYRLARKYNLELSLFERMINNDIKCNTLGWQHRMRPEIAELVHPIYPNLHNHPSVEGYEDVKGVSSNVFFINHGEAETSDSETKSHSNMYEARYMAQLCLYLLKQGYQASRITVLTTYSGQLFQLRKLMPKDSKFDGVHVTVVDNFQGEENDIILLSLVRSNEEGRIGFLKTENRVCVALSRAKMGLYVIANFDQLSESSDLWLTITTKLKAKGQLGETLNLYCQNHPCDEGLVIRTPRDFDNAPEGGCMKPCKARLDCGHVCTRLCHPWDKDHKEFCCQKKCERLMKCDFQHPCPKLCHEDCGDCLRMVEKTLECGHTQTMECYKIKCTMKCEKLMKCEYQHPCTKLCYEDCGDCLRMVEKTLECGHTQTMECYKDPKHFKCTMKCEKLMKCEYQHPCPKLCYEDCGKCLMHVQKKIPKCGHMQMMQCWKDPKYFVGICREKCEKLMECEYQHPCPKLCYEYCGQCLMYVEKKIPKCGHMQMMQCWQDPKDFPCREKCEKLMKCEYQHPCTKLCYEDCGKCLMYVEKKIPKCGHMQMTQCWKDPKSFTCREECQEMLPCGHKCEEECGQAHSHRCRSGEKVEVTRPCGHKGTVVCANKTWEPCDARCHQLLACGHRCEGACFDCHGGRLHQPCKLKCTKVLVCGHKCQGVCSICPPCISKCENWCPHGQCRKRCGEPCVSCKRPCVWRCPHLRCTKKCSEPCDRDGCNKPCRKKLPKCGHTCIGLCGEPCPRLCRVCDAPTVKKLCREGKKNVKTARFVELEDCGHVLEVSGLDQWMTTTTDQQEDSVQLKACPLCKTPIRHHLRYGSIIKTQLHDIETIKVRMLGEEERERKDLEADMKKQECQVSRLLKNKKKEKVLAAGKRHSLQGLQAMRNQMKFLGEVGELREAFTIAKVQRFCFYDAMSRMEDWACLCRSVWSQQEARDAEREMVRLRHWLALLCYWRKLVTPGPQRSVEDREEDGPLEDALQQMKEGWQYTESRQAHIRELLKRYKERFPGALPLACLEKEG
ncbi:NFX1-type zinc finger-containing protein 1-like [Babylonia areolata]|uniref:NFX1-type zinc finger-containing protein 1-like n=1 Tax=Babylonia areolata TaxID=304850 RepID=UPI003FD24086